MKGIHQPSFPISYWHWWHSSSFDVWIHCDSAGGDHGSGWSMSSKDLDEPGPGSSRDPGPRDRQTGVSHTLRVLCSMCLGFWTEIWDAVPGISICACMNISPIGDCWTDDCRSENFYISPNPNANYVAFPPNHLCWTSGGKRTDL